MIWEKTQLTKQNPNIKLFKPHMFLFTWIRANMNIKIFLLFQFFFGGGGHPSISALTLNILKISALTNLWS